MVLQKVGGGGKTYRLADNLSTDYKDFTELDELWNQQLVDNQQIMEVIAASDETMDLHARTPFVMDAVSTSSTAMDAVSTSSTAMDAVSASQLAWSAMFASDYSVSSLWASTPGVKTILESSGDKSLPYNTNTPGGDANIEVDDGTQSATPSGTAHHLWIDMNGADEGNYVSVTYTIDLSNSGTLEVKDKAEGGVDDSRFKHGIKVDGTSIFESGGLNGYNTRSLDISSYSGTHDVEFYADNTGYNGGENHDYYFADLNLI